MKGLRALYCTSEANWLHRPHSLAGSRPEHSAHLRSTGSTGRIHSPAADRITMRISGQPAAQAAFTRLQPTGRLSTAPTNRMHKQHSPACRQSDHSAHVRQLATQAFTRLQPTGPHRWSESSSWQLNHGFLRQNSTFLYD